MSEHVRYERHGHTALITIDRPEARNCIGPETHRELKAAWQRFLDEDDAYVAVLTGAGVASHMLLTAEPIDAQQALEWHMVTKVVPHDRLMEECETVARQILRNSQRAVRSAKETIAEVIGLHLDEQLRAEAFNAYTSADPEETLGLLQRFYDRTDEGRAA